MPTNYLIYNGELIAADAAIITASNRSFRYGDGCFETMKMIDGNIILQHLHWERLFLSLQILQFDLPHFFDAGYLSQQIKNLTRQNAHQRLARIRLTVFRGDGNLHDDNDQLHYIIQSWALQAFPGFNKEGFVVDVYEDARKAADLFSSLKTNNYLPYAMAAKWCKNKRLNDALILNCNHRIAEATTSNVFAIKNNIITTPSLEEGCIAGVVRNHLLFYFKKEGILCREATLTEEEILDADELFLTNAGWHIQWVKRFRSKAFTNQTVQFLYHQFIKPLLKKQ